MAQVKVYSTRSCPYCNMEKEYLKQKGIEFEDVLVDQRQDKIQDLVDTFGSMGVPCTHITKGNGTEERILGFDKTRIDATLGIA